MSKPKTVTVMDRVTEALEAIEAIKPEAAAKDRELAAALEAKQRAEEQAEKDRRKAHEATSKVDGLRAEIVQTRASVAAEVGTLRAEKEMLAIRDRESRDELERLRLASRGTKESLRGGNLPHFH